MAGSDKHKGYPVHGLQPGSENRYVPGLVVKRLDKSYLQVRASPATDDGFLFFA